MSTTYTPSTVALKRPRPAELRDLSSPAVRQSLEAEALKDAERSIDRYLRARKRRSSRPAE